MKSLEEIGWPLEEGRKFNSEYFTENKLIAQCEKNPWLTTKGEDEYSDYESSDYCFSFYTCNTIKELKEAIRYGNWAIRQGFIYKDLAFIQQVNAGDEWLTVKSDGNNHYYSFESCSFRFFDKVDEFKDFISCMHRATVKECVELDYTTEAYNAKYRGK